jgi:acyl carrier protein
MERRLDPLDAFSSLQIHKRLPVAQSSASPPHPTPPVSAAQLREFIVGIDTRIDLKKLTDETPFQDAGADSLDVFNLIVVVEDAYAIVIPSGDLSQVNTLDKLARYLNERLP